MTRERSYVNDQLNVDANKQLSGAIKITQQLCNRLTICHISTRHIFKIISIIEEIYTTCNIYSVIIYLLVHNDKIDMYLYNYNTNHKPLNTYIDNIVKEYHCTYDIHTDLNTRNQLILDLYKITLPSAVALKFLFNKKMVLYNTL